MAYLGKLTAESANTEGLYEFTATASQTTFVVAYTIGHIEIFLNGVKLASDDFTAGTGDSVVLTVPATLGDIVQIKTQNINGLVDGYTNFEVDAKFVEVDAKFVDTVLTGTPTAPTATAGTNTTQLATTAFVTTADNLKANLASPALTGVPTAPTATTGTNTTQLATTAFVFANSVQQGTGVGQLSNTVKIGWSGSRIKATVDATDMGNILTTANVTLSGTTLTINL
jgi:hypothetical protein